MMNYRYFLLMLSGICSFSTFAQSEITWQQRNQITVATDGSVVSTNDTAYSSHAYSIESISSDKNGRFEFTVNNCIGVVGITIDPQSAAYEKIDYAFQLATSNKLNIIENGIVKAEVGLWTKGDQLKIQKYYNTITYHKNGSQIYTSLTKSNSVNSYYVDFAIGGSNTGFDRPTLWEDNRPHIPFWQGKNAIIEFQNGSVASTSGVAYAAHAYSVDSIPSLKNGYFEFIVNNCKGNIGLNSNPRNGGQEQIEYAFQLKDSNRLNIVEKGITVADAELFTTGDVLKILKYNNTISYLKNGTVLYTSTVKTNASSSYYADFAIGGVDSGFDRPWLWIDGIGHDEFWQEKTEITELGDASVISLSNEVGASHAYSLKSIPGNRKGYFEFTVNNCFGIVGLSSTPQGGGHAQIDYAFQLSDANELYVIENGVVKTKLDKWSKGDVLRIYKEENSIDYYINGALKHKSTTPSNPEAYYSADFSFEGINTGFDNPVLWVDLVSSVADIQSSSDIICYPNPATDHITVGNQFEGQIHIYDTRGLLLNTFNKSLGTTSYNLGLPTGMYRLVFENEHKKINKTLIIK